MGNRFEKVSDTYDFREEIVNFGDEKDSAARHAIYQAIGIGSHPSKYKDTVIGKKEAIRIYEKYKSENKIISRDEADNCKLLLALVASLWEIEEYDINRKYAPITCDVMNSISITLNELFCPMFGKDEAIFGTHSGKAKWGKVTSVWLYSQEHGRYEKEYKRVIVETKGLEGFLSVAYTLGNFLPVPLGCNGPRGFGITRDYWDLALYCIYNWYQYNGKSTEHQKRYIESIFGGIKKEKKSELVGKYIKWLESFGCWDDYVRKNFMQPFVWCPDECDESIDYNYCSGPLSKPQWEKDYFGPPKPFWEGHIEHFNGKKHHVLPQEKCIIDFFCNAAAAIMKRSELMIERLEELH